MLISAVLMRVFLGLSVLGMALLAVFYLRQRRMSFREYLGWGLLAIFVPLLGPFWVIYMHPGQPTWPGRRRWFRTRKPPFWRRKRFLPDWSKKWVTGR